MFFFRSEQRRMSLQPVRLMQKGNRRFSLNPDRESKGFFAGLLNLVVRKERQR